MSPLIQSSSFPPPRQLCGGGGGGGAPQSSPSLRRMEAMRRRSIGGGPPPLFWDEGFNDDDPPRSPPSRARTLTHPLRQTVDLSTIHYSRRHHRRPHHHDGGGDDVDPPMHFYCTRRPLPLITPSVASAEGDSANVWQEEQATAAWTDRHRPKQDPRLDVSNEVSGEYLEKDLSNDTRTLRLFHYDRWTTQVTFTDEPMWMPLSG